ncbi:hypothetical protein HPB47_023711 [Ixodes persulcatus]|uniref:Uncharacterized protein n=1 Tax=Ixodes persulcatus TaxID=34615 RepID=A0AC60Q8L9_IXOPE|nr:hypothetical protein HPB47_023711 [Ixodes persulcatus]
MRSRRERAAVHPAPHIPPVMTSRGVLLSNVVVPLEHVRPCIIYASASRLPPYVPDDAFQVVIWMDRPHLFTGTRVFRIEMAKAVPNFVYAGHRVMCEYREMKRVCFRSGQEGHFGAA